MKVITRGQITLYDYEPVSDNFDEIVLDGLSREHKSLPSKLFYDDRGSELFDQICMLDEYYPTRTEIGILNRYAAEIAKVIGPGTLLAEFGSGSSTKTWILFDCLEDIAAYVPVDINKSQLISSCDAIAESYPGLELLPVCTDFSNNFSLPEANRPASGVTAFFPGSTIGNFRPEEAVSFLKRVAAMCGDDGGLLIGVDLQKDIGILEAAYNDKDEVTAAFNLNLLHRIAKEFNVDFPVDSFRHRAIYNKVHDRIEMHLVSLEEQSIRLNDHHIYFEKGEQITTEFSYKYSLESFAHIARQAGFIVDKVWFDDEKLFSVQYLRVR